MERKSEKIQSKFNDFSYIICAILIGKLLPILISALLYMLGVSIPNIALGFLSDRNIYKLIYMYIFTCVFVPIIESYIIKFVTWLLRNLFHVKKDIYLLLILSVLFTLTHTYSISYMIAVFPQCFIIIYSYICYKPKKISSFKIMLFVHMGINICAMILLFLSI